MSTAPHRLRVAWATCDLLGYTARVNKEPPMSPEAQLRIDFEGWEDVEQSYFAEFLDDCRPAREALVFG